jgi:hypothetical protein
MVHLIMLPKTFLLKNSLRAYYPHLSRLDTIFIFSTVHVFKHLVSVYILLRFITTIFIHFSEYKFL